MGGENPNRPEAPYTDHVFIAVGHASRPRDLVVIDAWQLDPRPVRLGDRDFYFRGETLLGSPEEPWLTPRAVRIEPDEVDYLRLGLTTLDRRALTEHMDYQGSDFDPRSYVRQPRMYELWMPPRTDRFGDTPMRGGSADHGVDPIREQWPVGREVTLMQPRYGDVSTGPAPVLAPRAGGVEGEFTRFDLPLPRAGAGSSSTGLGYGVNPAGWVELPDGTVVSPLGWTSFGDDFIHAGTGVVLRGDSGWIGRVQNIEQVIEEWDHLDPWAAPYTLIPHDTGIHMVPARPDSPAVHIPVTPRPATSETPPPATEPATEPDTEPDTAAQPPREEHHSPAQEVPSSDEQPPLSQEAQLAERGLEPVYIPAEGDELAHALTAVAPGESGQLAGHSWPAGLEELRNGLADAVAADLRRPPEERRLWPAIADVTGPEGTASPVASGGSEEDIVRALRTGSGPGASDWLTLAVAARVLGLRLTVLMPDGTSWTTGPDDGRPVVLLQQQDPGPYTARWAATEPAEVARQARRPSLTRTEETSDGGGGWGTTPSALSPPPSTAPAGLGTSGGRPTARPVDAGSPERPHVFFGSDPRPAPSVPRPRDRP